MPDNNRFVGNILKEWYSENKRELPWRDTKNPYLIWVSEVILQQTRVAQGYEYYLRFIDRFPNSASLAQAEEDEVLRLWQGLGYYSRARNLHAAAKMIEAEYAGTFPNQYKDILSLKGIGEYTAAAIASFAFNLPYAVLDGNVFRVLSRLFGIATPIDTSAGKNQFTELANSLLDKDDPATYNQAIMDFGALQCVPSSPDCTVCPFSERCFAYLGKSISQYPAKQGKIQQKERFFYYFDIRCGEYLYLQKREADDIWKNLYELPLIECSSRFSFRELAEQESFKNLFPEGTYPQFSSAEVSMKHVLSHRIIHATFSKVEIVNDDFLSENLIKVKRDDLDKYAISRLVDKYFEKESSQDLFR